MKAAVGRRSGPPERVLSMEDVARPAISETELLVRVAAAATNPADFFYSTPVAAMARRFAGGSRSAVPVVGTDFAGTVETVGSNVTTFRPGDQVFGGHRGAF